MSVHFLFIMKSKRGQRKCRRWNVRLGETLSTADSPDLRAECAQINGGHRAASNGLAICPAGILTSLLLRETDGVGFRPPFSTGPFGLMRVLAKVSVTTRPSACCAAFDWQGELLARGTGCKRPDGSGDVHSWAWPGSMASARSGIRARPEAHRRPDQQPRQRVAAASGWGELGCP